MAAAIRPLTDVNPSTDQGYFSDPYPIHTDRPAGVSPPQFSGTTQGVLTCSGPLAPECSTTQALRVTPSPSLAAAAHAHDLTLPRTENNNILQAADGSWEMVTTMFVQPSSTPKHRWTILVYAQPSDHVSTTTVPTSWTAETILVGSLASRAPADYDGKYYDDNGRLYLVYSKQVQSGPPRNGIVAQSMRSFSAPTNTPPQVLLAPSDTDGGYNSEDYIAGRSNGLKLIETGNITEIDGKFVMAYSTGAFDETDYKAGIAWSDTFLPAPGGSYERVLQQDTTGVWGQGNHPEPLYLLQSEKSAWPNYVASRVIAPGVPSIVDVDGHWTLFFAGYAPGDAPRTANGRINADHRRPFYVPLDVDIPAGASVADTSGFALDHWITVATG